MKKQFSTRGFSLIELIVVISIIALLASIVLTSFTAYRNRANDARRITEMKSIQNALELYYTSYTKYPNPDVDGCGWDIGNATHPLFNGVGMNSYFAGQQPPVDVFKMGPCDGYRYYKYPAGSYGCPPSRGDFYVLGVTNMESSDFPYPGSPGWSCPGRDWQNEFDWVAGSFEN